MNEDFKKTVIKEVCRMVINIITAAMVASGEYNLRSKSTELGPTGESQALTK